MKRDLHIIGTVVTLFSAVFIMLYIGMASAVNDPIIDVIYFNIPLLTYLYVLDLILWIVGLTLSVSFEK